jgi:hypothetical protein
MTEPLDDDAGTAWEERSGGPILVCARSGSAAARDLDRVTERADALVDRARAVLGLTIPDDPPIVLALEDEVEDDESILGETDPPLTAETRLLVRLVYRADAPGPGLERALVKRIIGLAIGEQAARATALVDGATGLLTPRDDDDQEREPVDPGSLMALGDVLDGLDRGEPRGLYFATATSFVSFLVRRHGPEAFRRYAQRFDPAAPEAAGRAAYGLSMDRLEAAWRTSLEQPDEPAPGGRSVVPTLLSLLRPYRVKCALIFAGLLVDLALWSALPLSFKMLIDGAIVPHDGRLLVRMVAGLVALALLASVAAVGRDYLYADIGARVMGDLRRAMFEKLQRLPMGYHARSSVGDIIARFSGDVAAVEAIVISAVPVALLGLLNTLVSLALLFSLERRLAVLALIGLPLGLIAPRALGARAATASYRRKRDEGRVMGFVNESMGAQAVIKGFWLQGLLLERFRNLVATWCAPACGSASWPRWWSAAPRSASSCSTSPSSAAGPGWPSRARSASGRWWRSTRSSRT